MRRRTVTNESSHAGAWVDRLAGLGIAVRDRLIETIRAGAGDLAEPVAHQGGDTIYAIDRHVESVIQRAVESWPDECKPLLLIAEGLGEGGVRRIGDPDTPLRHRVIVDPIDGTRNLMYDKRSAWFLAAVADDHGEATGIADTTAAVMVELPPSKQTWVDVFTAVGGRPALATRSRIDGSGARPLPLRPSSAETLRDGFAQVTNFFPGTKVAASELMEQIALRTLGEVEPGRATVFDDQYITTGGQMVELMVGHDRFCCDLRPLFYEILAEQGEPATHGLECHPYDVAGALVARQAGVVLTDGFGRELNAPLDVHTGVHWCGYANASLRRLIEPIIRDWLGQHGLEVPSLLTRR